MGHRKQHNAQAYYTDTALLLATKQHDKRRRKLNLGAKKAKVYIKQRTAEFALWLDSVLTEPVANPYQAYNMFGYAVIGV
jgi:hypothetical protein